MTHNYPVYVVDDDETMRLVIEATLSDLYPVMSFDSSEGCLAYLQKFDPAEGDRERAATRLPGLFLLDVSLPGISGYELCRQIKALPGGREVPVIFISVLDTPDDVMAGYDAGAGDYISKPIDVSVLRRKIDNLRRLEKDRKALKEMADSSDQLATLMMSNLDDYALLIKFLRSLNECTGYDAVVAAVLQALASFKLDGAVQIRVGGVEKTVSRQGENWPMEIRVMDHVRTLERIFEFGTRAAYNFAHITILITNMPSHDAELCGRIRDNIAIAAESADAKLAALAAIRSNAQIRDDVRGTLQAVGEALASAAQHYDRARYQGSEYLAQFLDDLLKSFARLGMSTQQEDEILEMVKRRSIKLIALYDIADETEATLNDISARLAGIVTRQD